MAKATSTTSAKPVKKIARPSLAKTKKELSNFLEHNPCSHLVESGGKPGQKVRFIEKPWGDASVALFVPSFARRVKFMAAINQVILPESLSAIYHIDTRQLEVLWTAYTRPPEQQDVVGRRFTFKFQGNQHVCDFRKSSDRLLDIAREAIFLGVTSTGYRNLQSFELIANPTRKIGGGPHEQPSNRKRLSQPVSFFIENIDWDEEKVLEIIRHINFYLKYFDNLSPVVLIHQPLDASSSAKRSRFVDGEFPESIEGRALDPTLTAFWSAAFEGDASRRFLYHYRIIEYVSYFHLDATVKVAIRKLLSGPNTLGNLDDITDRVTELVRESKADEYARFKATVIELVQEKHIWREVCLNANMFCQDIGFDGGFKLKGLLSSATATGLGPHGMDNFVNSLRDIRNALSHGRDQKSGLVILPTVGNFRKLQPWVNLIATAAAEVVLYEGIS